MSILTHNDSFGGWFRFIRIDRKLTLRAAAKKLGMDPGNLSKLERSEFEPPKSAKKIEQMCKKIGASGSDALLKSVAFQHHLALLHKEFYE